jgi:hypothetical protein
MDTEIETLTLTPYKENLERMVDQGSARRRGSSWRIYLGASRSNVRYSERSRITYRNRSTTSNVIDTIRIYRRKDSSLQKMIY